MPTTVSELKNAIVSELLDDSTGSGMLFPHIVYGGNTKFSVGPLNNLTLLTHDRGDADVKPKSKWVNVIRTFLPGIARITQRQ